ncbi:MAG: hypothetical protein IT223_03815 [Crocinitomicaceae bacterium]|nr:hypothetical protein [Crocinitomicaceae bacterium]
MKRILFSVICGVSIFTSFMVRGQSEGVSINSSGAAPHPSAMIDISSTTKGALIPRMTLTERNAISYPALGLQVFNTTTNCVNIWMGSSWKQICGDCDFNSPVAGNSGPLCEGSNLQLTATSIVGATYQWTGPDGYISNSQNPVISNATASASGSYSVTATLNGCTSQPQSTVATINATPATPTATNDGPACVGAPLSLSATTINNASYSWAGPNGYSAAVQNPVISNAEQNNAGNYSVVASVNGCNSAPGSTSVSINATPLTPGTITGSSTVCANATGQTYSISPVAGATSYNWYIPAGASIESNNGTSIAITMGSSSGNVSVTASNSCGTSSASILSVTVNPVPSSAFSINPSSPITGQSVTFSANTSGATYAWTFPSGNPSSASVQNTSSSWSSGGTYNVELTVLMNGCSSTTTTPLVVASCQPVHFRTYSFTQNSAPSGAQCSDWTAFRASLTPGSYCSVTLSGSQFPGGYVCTDATAVNQIASFLKNGPSGTIVSCNGMNWSNHDSIDWFYVYNNVGASCDKNACLRPCIGNLNWGGFNTQICGAPTQTISISFNQ